MQHYDAREINHRKRVAELLQQIDALHDEVFMAQTRAVILEAEALLLRYDMEQALRQAERA